MRGILLLLLLLVHTRTHARRSPRAGDGATQQHQLDFMQSCDSATTLPLVAKGSLTYSISTADATLCDLRITWPAAPGRYTVAGGPPWRTLFAEARHEAGITTFEAPSHTGPPELLQHLSQLKLVSADGSQLPVPQLVLRGYPVTMPYAPQLPPVDSTGHGCASVEEPWGNGVVAGGMQVVVDGRQATWFATRIPGLGDGVLATSSDWMTMKHSNFQSPRAYVASDCTRPYDYEQLRLLGGSITYELDLSAVGCNCIGAFYLSSMPARDASGARAAGDDSYCDAPGYNGFPCPEMDLVEANRFTLATTLHGCLPYAGAPDRWQRHADNTYPNGALYGACDDWGCAASTNALPAGSYGPGRANTIDTSSPFEVKVAFPVDVATGHLGGVTTTLMQAGRTVEMQIDCDSNHLSLMTRPLAEGMVAVGSHWGGDASWVSWLDAPYPCPADENCFLTDTGTAFTLRKLSIEQGSFPA
eukprot:7376128-Prymnesium_polylepis.1